ncbi:hypothetical protein COO91_06897 [Nostoc flagelliforme CCNUN1]|uniref:Uncharacterized protein n=1 Tax=Nostoc flagelliforme CCNUN1 TaxID=2038116 RepID=A0A2K8SZT6_9NOSO|nr:hypothetical protein COO91_06897 [Nostoc flagelliforme CCNUN1]
METLYLVKKFLGGVISNQTQEGKLHLEQTTTSYSRENTYEN